MPSPVGGIQVDNREVLEALARLGAWSVKGFEHALRDIGDHLVTSTKERFHTETAPDGTPWVVTARKRRNPSARILYQSGRLFRSIHRSVNRSAGTVDVRSDQRYAYQLHHGNPRGRPRKRRAGETPGRKVSPLPARPIFGIASGDEAELLAIVQRHALKAWR